MNLSKVFIIKEVHAYQDLIDRAGKLGFRPVSQAEIETSAPDAVEALVSVLDPPDTTGANDEGCWADYESGQFVANSDFSKMAYYPDDFNGHWIFWSREVNVWDLNGTDAGCAELYDDNFYGGIPQETK